MLSRLIALLAAVGFVLSASPRLATAADAAPVVVKSCSLDRFRLSLDVTFTNVSQKVVTSVRLAIKTRSDILSMKDDAGTFAPGDVTSHRLRVDQEYFEMWAKVSCDVARVTLQDGSTWENPAQPSEMEGAIKQTPGSNITLSRCNTGAGARIKFTNDAKQDATQVTLGLVQHGLLVLKDADTGTFTPGTPVERDVDFQARNQKVEGTVVDSDLLQDQCIILGVTYADGTSWTNSSVPPESLKGLTFDPPAPSPTDPITISNCDGSSLSNYGAGDWRVDYQNASQKPTVAADFAIFMHGHLLAIARDLHNLAPGEGSLAKFPLLEPKFYHPICVPINAEFADGTQWINPAFAPAKN